MSKRTRKIVGLLMGLLMILSVVAPATAMAVVPSDPPSTARPETGNLHIHKLVFNDGNFDDTIINNDGLSRDVSMYEKLSDVEFTIYFADAFDVDADASQIDPSTLTQAGVGTTDGNGYLKFANLDAGRYLVVETNTPKGVTDFSPQFLVDVPMMNPNGSEWNTEVHVYPKNQLILGAVELSKLLEDKETLLDGAEFNLYKVGDGTDELLLENVKAENGLLFVGELEIGDYYFREVKSPEGFSLDGRKIEFTVGLDNHAYNDGVIDTQILKVEHINYKLPEIEKSISEQGQLEDSADFFERVTWFIRADIPGNIVEATSYIITDTFPNALTYAGGLSVLADGNPFTAFTTNDVAMDTEGGELILTFDVEALEGKNELIISFDTFINENAIMGIDYENKVQLDYNNGFAEYVAFPEENPFVWTGGRQFIKVDYANPDVILKGAEFIIQNSDGLYLTEDYTWIADRDSNVVRKFVSDDSGLFEIKGLAEGNYVLIETKAPTLDGVQYRLGADINFVIDRGSFGPDSILTITNRPEMRLPQTGGMGTLLFSILGLGLMGTSAKLYKKSEKK